MDITQIPNLKPLRDYDEHEVLNFFAHKDASANKGTFVSIVANDGNTNVRENGNDPATPFMANAGSLSNVPSRATVLRHEVSWKVKTATSGEYPLGIMLYDVREENAFGEKYIYRPLHERAENDIVVSGEAVPVLTRGVVKINGFVGAPDAGSGAVVSATSGGYVDVTASPADAGNVGVFLSSPDADGYALFKLTL
jgi:hypothetical protein